MLDDDVRPTLLIRVDNSNHAVVVTVHGDLDMATAGTLANALEAVGSEDGDRVVVDLDNVGFIDASGLHVLLMSRMQLAKRGVRLCVRNPRSQARRLFGVALDGEQFETDDA